MTGIKKYIKEDAQKMYAEKPNYHVFWRINCSNPWGSLQLLLSDLMMPKSHATFTEFHVDNIIMVCTAQGAFPLTYSVEIKTHIGRKARTGMAIPKWRCIKGRMKVDILFTGSLPKQGHPLVQHFSTCGS